MRRSATTTTSVKPFTRNWERTEVIERFVDTSGWAEWADRSLLFHSQAVACFGEVWSQGGRLVTTSLVLVELTALLTSPLRMAKLLQIQFLDDLRRDPCVKSCTLMPPV